MDIPELLSQIGPFLKGVIGWSAASFAYENFVKPSKSRRQLARVLAEEVAQVLQMAVHQAEFNRLQPKTVPGDFLLHQDVYKALISRVGEFPDGLVGDLILFHQRVAVINDDTRRMHDAIDKLERIKRDPDHNGGLGALKSTEEYLRTGMIVWHGHFPVIVEQGNRILGQLRVAETPFGKLGYIFRKKPALDIADVRNAVVARHDRLERDRDR